MPRTVRVVRSVLFQEDITLTTRWPHLSRRTLLFLLAVGRALAHTLSAVPRPASPPHTRPPAPAARPLPPGHLRQQPDKRR